MDAKLTQQESKQLHDALLEAFPSAGALEQAIYYQFGEHLPKIIGDISSFSLNELVYKVIQWAEASGQTTEMIEAARKVNPGNLKLHQFANLYEIKLLNPTTTLSVSKRALTPQLRKMLIQALLKMPLIDTFDYRRSLTIGIPYTESLMRSPHDARTDLEMIIDQLSDLGRLKSGRWPLLIIIDNALAHMKSSSTEKELQRVQQKIAERYEKYGESEFDSKR